MASEKGIAQTNLRIGVVGPYIKSYKFIVELNLMGSKTVVGDSPVDEIL